MVQKNGNDKLIARIVYNGPVRAPIAAGQQVGVVKVWRGANVAMETPVYAAEAVGKGSTMRRGVDGVSELVIGRFARAPRSSDDGRGSGQTSCADAGRFITFEGGEGSGKSTQIKMLAERLDAAKLRAIVTREPGGSPGAEIIRHLVLSGMGKLLGPEAETLLFAAARDDHVAHRDRARAQAGHMGAVRPVFGFDAGLSRQARARCAASFSMRCSGSRSAI